MRTRYISSIIMLLAGTITCAFCLIKSYSVDTTLEVLLGVLIVFYIIGLVARNLVNKIITTDFEQPKDMEIDAEDAEAGSEGDEHTATEE